MCRPFYDNGKYYMHMVKGEGALERKLGSNITNVQIFSRCENGYVHHQCDRKS